MKLNICLSFLQIGIIALLHFDLGLGKLVCYIVFEQIGTRTMR